MAKGMISATFCPALALHLAQRGLSKAYCGLPHTEYGWTYDIIMFFVVWLATDYWKFAYHRMGHLYDFFWNIHKGHHQFYNPSPFAVIADEYVDQFVRAFPLLLFPLLFPVNMDILFFQFGFFFYAYGSYLHWGYELEYPDAHHPILNTAFQHYCHHAVSIKNKPYHTGFFLKIWDQLCGSMYDGECFCSKCAREKGLRTRERYDAIEKPDYSPLFKVSFWVQGIKGEGVSE